MRIYYLEIVTADVDATCAAYSKALNLDFGEPAADLGNARTAPAHDGGLIGVRAPMHASEPAVVRPYWLVDDVEVALEQAVAAGGEVVHPALAIDGRGTFAIYALGEVHHGLWQL